MVGQLPLEQPIGVRIPGGQPNLRLLRFLPHYIEHMRPELNGLFREEDYPSADALRKKSGLKRQVLPDPRRR
jgi:hypothetical protein